MTQANEHLTTMDQQVGPRGRFTLRQASGEIRIHGVEGDRIRVRSLDDDRSLDSLFNISIGADSVELRQLEKFGLGILSINRGAAPEIAVEVPHGATVSVESASAEVAAAQERERGTDDDHRSQVGRGFYERRDRLVHPRQQGVLQQEVLDGVAAQAELRENRDRDTVVVALPHLGQHGRGVRRRVGQRDGDRACRHAREPLGVGRVELHPFSLGIHRPRGGFETLAERAPQPPVVAGRSPAEPDGGGLR